MTQDTRQEARSYLQLWVHLDQKIGGALSEVRTINYRLEHVGRKLLIFAALLAIFWIVACYVMCQMQSRVGSMARELTATQVRLCHFREVASTQTGFSMS
jgi:hypothetical protein